MTDNTIPSNNPDEDDIDDVLDGVDLSDEDFLEVMEALPEVAEEYKTRFGVKHFIKGLTGGVDLRVEEVFTPTCTICGLTSGYQGPGSKTVLPARASAKVDFRLVPDQDPDDIRKKLRAHLDEHGFSDVQITDLGGEPPAPGTVDCGCSGWMSANPASRAIFSLRRGLCFIVQLPSG